MKKILLVFALGLGFILSQCRPVSNNDGLYSAYDVSRDSIFMPWAEGPAVDTQGNLYAVNFGERGTIGIIRQGGQAELFIKLPVGSVGNGIRLWGDRVLLVADYTLHNILAIDIPTREMWIWAHCADMNQPNDLAVRKDGVLFASDPDWEKETGNLWKILPDGSVHLLEEGMGTTNGVEVSPDEKRLYVNESVQRKIWVYDIMENGDVENKRLFKEFPDFGMDGMRCDVEGNLYVTRFGKGTVVILTPEGKVKREVLLKGKQPTNIAFGGKEGKTVFVTVADRGCIEAFEVDVAGRSQELINYWEGQND